MSRVVGLAPALPGRPRSQAEVTAVLAPLLARDPAQRRLLERVHAHAGVSTRHLTLPLDGYRELGSFTAANDLYLRHATALGGDALGKALAQAGLAPSDVDFLLVTSVTGVGAPSLDVLLVDQLGLRPDMKRLPSFGLGCAGGAAGLARVHDYLVGHPRHVAALVAVELCSLTLQAGDPSTANLVATGLFGDGAAAAVLVGDDHPAARVAGHRPSVVDTHGVVVPGTARHLGWHVGSHGLRILLDAELPTVVGQHLPAAVATLLDRHGLAPSDVDTWVVHAGGPRIIDAVRDALSLDEGAVASSRESLSQVGNLSSASVLHVLHLEAERLAGGTRPPAHRGVLMAFGPGVSVELVLLQWDGPAAGP
jgi:alkylresorcinol/alkylpyrone synthase